MADIDIVPKRRSGSLWLWIVIALVIVAVLWFALSGRHQSARVGLLGQPVTVAAVSTGAAGQG